VLVYADEAALGAWVSPMPDNAAALLRAASRLVRRATVNDRYDTTPAGLPSEPEVIAAFENATCQHAAFWAANDIDPDAGIAGLEQVETSSSIAGASVSLDSGQAAAIAESLRASLDGLVPAAMDYLTDEGLGSSRPGVW